MTTADPFMGVAREIETYAWAEYYTGGTYESESDSALALALVIKRLGYFDILQEVSGQYLQFNLDQEFARPRIDCILVPSPQLLAMGWAHGLIGVECKRSNEKIGRPISQMLDYRKAAYPVNGITVMLNYVLLWPWAGCGGPIASILAQQRLGHIYKNTNGTLFMGSGQKPLASFTPECRPKIFDNPQGRKVGSR